MQVLVDGKWQGEIVKRDERFIYVRYNLGATEVEAIMSPPEFERRTDSKSEPHRFRGDETDSNRVRDEWVKTRTSGTNEYRQGQLF